MANRSWRRTSSLVAVAQSTAHLTLSSTLSDACGRVQDHHANSPASKPHGAKGIFSVSLSTAVASLQPRGRTSVFLSDIEAAPSAQ